MSYYHTCPECGAHLDPGEKCDCELNERKVSKHENRIQAEE